MTEDPSPAPPVRRAGGCALAFGLMALVFALVPVVGDLVSVPTAVLAVICGLIGAGHDDAGRSPRLLPSLTGALLGGASLLISLVTLLAATSAG